MANNVNLFKGVFPIIETFELFGNTEQLNSASYRQVKKHSNINGFQRFAEVGKMFEQVKRGDNNDRSRITQTVC